MPEFIDTHTHLFVQEFDDDRNATVERALSAGVRNLCLPCIDESSIEPIREMCREYPGICHAMIGLHPTEVDDNYRSVLERIYAILKKNREFIAVGEVGLDFYWDDTRKREQTDALMQQIEWASETGLPLAIHSRSAFDELYSVMESYRSKGLSGVFHCFSGSEEQARKLLTFDGFCLGIGGVVTYRKSVLPAVLASVPLERIVLETDSPYLPPAPYRGKRNESSYIPYIAQFLATLYGCSVERVAEVTTANAMRIFPKING